MLRKFLTFLILLLLLALMVIGGRGTTLLFVPVWATLSVLCAFRLAIPVVLGRDEDHPLPPRRRYLLWSVLALLPALFFPVELIGKFYGGSAALVLTFLVALPIVKLGEFFGRKPNWTFVCGAGN